MNLNTAAIRLKVICKNKIPNDIKGMKYKDFCLLREELAECLKVFFDGENMFETTKKIPITNKAVIFAFFRKQYPKWLKNNRKIGIKEARQVLQYALYSFCKYSLKEIAELTKGDRINAFDHTTMLYSKIKVANMVEQQIEPYITIYTKLIEHIRKNEQNEGTETKD